MKQTLGERDSTVCVILTETIGLAAGIKGGSTACVILTETIGLVAGIGGDVIQFVLYSQKQ